MEIILELYLFHNLYMEKITLTWSRSMIMALNAKNKVGYVDDSIIKPSTSSSNFAIWTKCNNMVISWIINSISKELPSNIIYFESTQDIWSDLKDCLYQGNGPQVFQLQKAISTISQDQLFVSSYFTKMKGLCDELLNYSPTVSCSCCSYGAIKTMLDFQHQEYVMWFLMGLNDSYSSIRG